MTERAAQSGWYGAAPTAAVADAQPADSVRRYRSGAAAIGPWLDCLGWMCVISLVCKLEGVQLAVAQVKTQTDGLSRLGSDVLACFPAHRHPDRIAMEGYGIGVRVPW